MPQTGYDKNMYSAMYHATIECSIPAGSLGDEEELFDSTNSFLARILPASLGEEGREAELKYYANREEPLKEEGSIREDDRRYFTIHIGIEVEAPDASAAELALSRLADSYPLTLKADTP